MRASLWLTLLLCAWSAAAQETAAQQFSLAESHVLLGENQKALAAYRTARELCVAAGDPLGQGSTWKGEAEVLSRLGDDQAALDAYRHAGEIFLAAGDQLGQGDAWRGVARTLSRLGDDQQALVADQTAQQLLRAARQVFLASGDELRLGHTWYGEAEILNRFSEKKPELATKALYDYEQALKRYLATGSRRDQANTWKGEADAYRRLGEDQKALVAYRKAREIFKAVGDHEGQGDTWFGEAQTFMGEKPSANDPDTARMGSAVKAAEAAITAYQSAGVVASQINVLLFKAETEAKREKAAEEYATNGPKIPVAQVGPLTVAVSFPGLYKKLIRMLAKPDTHSPEEAIRLHGTLRGTATRESDRIRREEEIRRAYDLLVTLRARQKGQTAEALRLAEEARSRVLLDLLATPPPPGEKALAADLTAERERLETGIAQIEEQLRGSPPLEKQERLRAQRLQLELKWNAVGKESLLDEHPLDAAAMESLARETGPLLVYYVTASEVWGFLIRPETAEIYSRSIAVSQDELENRIHALRFSFSNPSHEQDAQAQALALAHLLIDPFFDRLPESGPLVLVPHGPLHELPFESLRDAAGKRLFDRWQISLAPSVSALDLARRRHAAPLPNDTFLGFASGRGLNLPAEEVAQIAEVFGADKSAFQPAVASYQSYVDHVAQARHLLISTVGVETYLEIEATPSHDNHLTAAEIAKIPLHAELVTLAACDTSHGKALKSDERLDLTRSFLIAGAAAVLAARWRIPENSATSHFLADFYQAYRRGGPGGTALRKDEALTEARRRSRARGDPAQVWAAWVLIGDAR